jgi:hypothetical protein
MALHSFAQSAAAMKSAALPYRLHSFAQSGGDRYVILAVARPRK